MIFYVFRSLSDICFHNTQHEDLEATRAILGVFSSTYRSDI